VSEDYVITMRFGPMTDETAQRCRREAEASWPVEISDENAQGGQGRHGSADRQLRAAANAPIRSSNRPSLETSRADQTAREVICL